MNRRRFLIGAAALAIATPVMAYARPRFVGAVYATRSKLLLRVYIPDHWLDDINDHPIAQGETLMRVPYDLHFHGGAKFLQSIIGIAAHSGRCALVHKDTKKVINVIVADPDLYHHPDGHLTIQDDYANIGHIWDGNKFRSEEFV
jgi:hypothetical protein